MVYFPVVQISFLDGRDYFSSHSICNNCNSFFGISLIERRCMKEKLMALSALQTAVEEEGPKTSWLTWAKGLLERDLAVEDLSAAGRKCAEMFRETFPCSTQRAATSAVWEYLKWLHTGEAGDLYWWVYETYRRDQ